MKKTAVSAVAVSLLILGTGCGAKTAVNVQTQPVDNYNTQANPQPQEPVNATPQAGTTPGPDGGGVYANSELHYQVGVPAGGGVRNVLDRNKGQGSLDVYSKNTLQLIEVNSVADVNQAQALVHVKVYSDDKEYKNLLASYKTMGLNYTTKTINGNKMAIFSGNVASDVGGSYPVIRAFVSKRGYTYEMEILAAGSDPNGTIAAQYLNSFKVN